MALVVDSGVLIAALVPSDDDHTSCSQLLDQATERLVVPAPVLPELDYFCTVSKHPHQFDFVLRNAQKGALEIAELTEPGYARVRELFLAYVHLGVGFVDCAVLAIVERLKETKLATLDHRHFSAMKPAHVEALELLPA